MKLFGRKKKDYCELQMEFQYALDKVAKKHGYTQHLFAENSAQERLIIYKKCDEEVNEKK